jgi:hypothetical protein
VTTATTMAKSRIIVLNPREQSCVPLPNSPACLIVQLQISEHYMPHATMRDNRTDSRLNAVRSVLNTSKDTAFRWIKNTTFDLQILV